MKINKKLTILISLLVVAIAFLVYFIVSSRYNASTLINNGTMPNQSPSPTQTNTATTPNQPPGATNTQNNYSNQILALEQTNYPGTELAVGEITQVGGYLRADVGEPDTDGGITGLYKLDSGEKITKIQEIDLDTIVKTGNNYYGKPSYISNEDWLKLIYNY